MQTLTTVLWAMLQNWGFKILTIAFFFLLTRLLNPIDIGVVSAALLLIQVGWAVAEFGFVDALVQKPDLKPADLNLPFVISLMTSLLLALALVLARHEVGRLMNVPRLDEILGACAALLPLYVIEKFQESLYRRQLKYKSLAIRTMVGVTLGGVVAIVMAYYGLGVWSLVAQNLVTLVLSIIFLWARPLWRPRFDFDPVTFRSLTGFGINIFYSRILDFLTTRSIDFVIVTFHGAVALGFYSVGSRLYATLSMLLQWGLWDVGLSLLSRVSPDNERLKVIYPLVITLVAFMSPPVFVLFGIISHDFVLVFFGKSWENVGSIMQPLMLLGGIQCVQFFNGPFMASIGKTQFFFYMNMLQLITSILALLLTVHMHIDVMVIGYCLSQIVLSPINFFYTSKSLGLPFVTVIGALWPILAASYVPGLVLLGVRQAWGSLDLNEVTSMLIMSFAYAFTYGSVVFLCLRKSVGNAVSSVMGKKVAG